MGLDILKKDTCVAIANCAADFYCTPMAMTLVAIWCEGNPKLVMRLETEKQLLPFLIGFVPDLDRAQELRVAPSNSHLADHEILELAGLPLILAS